MLAGTISILRKVHKRNRSCHGSDADGDIRWLPSSCHFLPFPLLSSTLSRHFAGPWLFSRSELHRKPCIFITHLIVGPSWNKDSGNCTNLNQRNGGISFGEWLASQSLFADSRRTTHDSTSLSLTLKGCLFWDWCPRNPGVSIWILGQFWTIQRWGYLLLAPIVECMFQWNDLRCATLAAWMFLHGWNQVPDLLRWLSMAGSEVLVKNS